MTEPLYTRHAEMPSGPLPLLVALDGWIDAGAAMSLAREVIGDHGSTRLVAEFDTDLLIDHRARRPILEVVDGLTTSLTWSRLDLLAGQDPAGNPFLLLSGAEPDTRWRGFTEAVVDLAVEANITRLITLGAYPAAVPHTRPTLVSTTATESTLLTGREHTTGSIEVPSGVHAPIEQALAHRGIGAMGLWGQVPYYAASFDYPAAAVALLENLAQVSDLRFPTEQVDDRIAPTRAQLDGMVAENEKYQQMLAELEDARDRMAKLLDTTIPTGDELEAELQQFLRNQGEQ